MEFNIVIVLSFSRFSFQAIFQVDTHLLLLQKPTDETFSLVLIILRLPWKAAM